MTKLPLPLSLRIVFLAAALGAAARAAEAVKIDPNNPRYLSFRGKPLALITATEHYGSVINRPFDFEKYLRYAAQHKLTLTRTFLLFRELQSARNPSSPCKPESPDYIAPFPRTGPGKALDGEPMYDLDQWNPEYFTRLHRFLDAASERGIVVELTVFSNTYVDSVWALNPFNARNNRQHISNVSWQEYITLRDPELVHRQRDFARKIVQETSGYDNVYYEICNEPGGAVPGHASPAEVDAWQQEMARTIRAELQHLNRPHLIAGQQAFSYGTPMRFPLDATFESKTFDIVNVHPLPNTELGGQSFQLGQFMSKELTALPITQFCQMAFARRKPTVLDEDNTASMYRDETGWTIHRKRAWLALLNGAHYDYIDFSIQVGREAGTALSRRGLASRMQHLSEFMSSFDFIHAEPSLRWIGGLQKPVIAAGATVADHDFVAYLADGREVTDPTAGSPITGQISLALPAGNYLVQFYSPQTGAYSPALALKGNQTNVLNLSPFRDDIVIRAQRDSSR